MPVFWSTKTTEERPNQAPSDLRATLVGYLGVVFVLRLLGSVVQQGSVGKGNFCQKQWGQLLAIGAIKPDFAATERRVYVNMKRTVVQRDAVVILRPGDESSST